MKRGLLTFLALLAVGALVLWAIDLALREPSDDTDEAAPETTVERSRQQGELTPVETGRDKTGQVALSGPGELFLKDMEQPDQPLSLHVKWRDSRTLGDGSIDLIDAEFERYDVEERALQASGVVERMRPRITRRVELDMSTPIPARDVQITYHSGSRFAPLRIDAPEIELRLEEQRATSDEMVTITGVGIAASGRGLEMDGLGESFTLRSEPRARIELDGGGEALLEGRGALVARSRPDLVEPYGPQAATIEVLDGGVLTFTGERPLEASADSIVLFGRVDREQQRFIAMHAEALGSVRVQTRAEGGFGSQRLVLSFDGRGRPLRAAFDGEPVLELALREASLENVPRELLVEGDALTVHGEGAGPLEVFLESPERFEFHGPARLTLPGVGAVLECRTRFAGELAANGSLKKLTALGAARATYEQWKVATEELLAEAITDNDGRPATRLTAPGATTVEGVLSDQSALDLRADGGLVIDQARDYVLVRRASQALVEIRGEREYRARADEVYDFDPERIAFLAEGDVEFRSPFGGGRGDRLEAWAIDRAELAGSPDDPARFELFDGERKQGVFEAVFVEAQGDLVHARGGAHAVMSLEGLEYDLRAPWVVLERRGGAEGPDPVSDLTLLAGGGVNARMERRGRNLEGEERLETVEFYGESFRAQADAVRNAAGREVFEPTIAIAEGDVRFDYVASYRFSGEGERLELRGDRAGRLLPAEGEKAKLRAGDLIGEVGFTLEASQVDFSPERLTAIGAEGDIDGLTIFGSDSSTPPEARHVRFIAGVIDCDPRSITLSESVYLGGKTRELEDWDLDCGAATIELKPEDAPASELGPVKSMLAWGGFRLRMGSQFGARGALLRVSDEARTLVAAGDPDDEELGVATLERDATSWSAPRIELDLDTGHLRSNNATVQPLAQDERDSWTLTYEALEPLDAGDDTIQIFRAPVWRSGDLEVRAAWALVWVDAAQWRMLGSRIERGVRDPDTRTRPHMKQFFGRVDLSVVDDWLHEIYLDGDVEYRIGGQTQMRAEGAYMDIVDGHGWLMDVVLDVELPVGSRNYALRIRADWLRSSVDGSMQTENAVATTCTHAEPHYVIKIGNFSRTARYVETTRRDPVTGQVRTVEKLDGWDMALEDNAIDFLGAFAVPLPRIAGQANKDGKFDKDSLSLGSFRPLFIGRDSKLGTFVSASITTELGPLVKSFHRFLGRMFKGSVAMPDLPEGNTRTHVDLNSRGIVLGTESVFGAPGHYRWSVIFDAIYDDDQDRGLVRVDQSDRDDGRAWLRSRGRYLLGPQEWLDFVVTRQTDPGVQAEFYESEYLRFEERETFVHWRRAQDEHYTSATLEARVEDFRTEVIDQPTANVFKGRSEIGRLGPLPIVQSGQLSLSHLARFDGDPRYEAPFADGLGDRDLLRVDGVTRYETPWTTGVAGVRVTPFVEGRATGWSENAAQDDRAGRAAVIAGLQTSTSFWKRFASGSRHVWTPSIAYRGDLAHFDSGGAVAFFDPVDAPIEGRFVDLAVRSRWEHREYKSDLDIELVQTHAESVAPGQRDGWLPLVARSTWLSRAFGMPFGVAHDGRYDLEAGDTTYSRTLIGVEPTPGLDLEVGYYTARDLLGDDLYDAASVGARYQFTRKWEIEGRQTFSARSSGDRLSSSLTLRRFGHDFVFEIENSFIAGEGRSSLRFKVTPLFMWRNASPSWIDRWRAARQ